MIPYNSIIVYVTPKKKRYIKKLTPGDVWHTNDGALAADAVAALEYGAIARTSLGMPVRVEEATLYDLLMGIKRKTQIIYPKDIAQICLRLGAGPDRTIVEAGCGSGSLTLALSWFCGPTGKVVSHDSREEFTRLARRNLDWAGLGANVVIHNRDVSAGFEAAGADALFLDMREPWLCLGQIPQAVRPGATLGFLLPTTPQVSALLDGLETGPFGEVEVCEILLRPWKPLADRLRPADRMTSHTGFLVFCRYQKKCPEFDSWLAPGTRERKQLAAALEKQAARSAG
ncbi:MAG: tRNA (adenine-N1)-methyltransferase [Desulfovibrio sp.]|nr:tRNA (adenine-N1)-methyltransferase [Desulfovibrio sp.]